MKHVRFWKMQAIGNDFVLVHADDVTAHDLPTLARNACHRHTGVGADGLLVMQGRELRMFNPDGTEDFCGNGLRCATVHAFNQGWIDRADTIIHKGIPVRVCVAGDHRSRVELGGATFAPDQVPHIQPQEIFDQPGSDWNHVDSGLEHLRISSLSTGSTHTILISDSPVSDDAFMRIGAAFESASDFPERTSAMFVHRVNERHLKMRPFERGAGPTLGCGTGSAATAVVWSRLTGATGSIKIENPGGTVAVTLEHWQGPILLESDVETLFEGVLHPEWLTEVLAQPSMAPLG